MLKTVLLTGFILGIALFSACEHQPYVLPVSERTGDSALCFDRDLLPMFISQCAKSGCHDAGTHKKGYVLDSYENIIKKGIVPGNYAASRIYMSVTGTTEQMMPKGADNLTEEQISLIKRWIVKGAIKDNNCTPACDSDNYVFSSGVQPIVNKYCTGCHSGATPQGNLLLTSYSEIKSAVQSRNLIKCINYETGYSGMPNSGLHLSTCEIRQFEKWVAAGMLNN